MTMLDHALTKAVVDLFLTKLFLNLRDNNPDRLPFIEQFAPIVGDSVPPVLLHLIERMKRNNRWMTIVNHLIEKTDELALKELISHLIVQAYLIGKEMISQHENQFGFLIPFVITYDLNREEPFYLHKRNVESIVTEAEGIGIYLHQFILYHPKLSLRQVLDIAHHHPNSLFILCVEPQTITLNVVQTLKPLNHVLLFLQMEPYSAFQDALSLLKRTRKPIGGFVRIGNQQLESYLTERHLSQLVADGIHLQLLIPQRQHRFDQTLIEKVNQKSPYPVLSVDARAMVQDMGRSLFGIAREFTIYSSGRCVADKGKTGFLNNRSLLNVLKEIMPRKIK